MISPEKIDEWLREIEERPASAAIILRSIANRLRDLSIRNEELLAENIALRLGKKLEEYENRIANLEYQLDLLKRQLGGEPGTVLAPDQVQGEGEAASILLFNSRGQILRVPLRQADLVDGRMVASFDDAVAPGETARLLAANPSEELLFVFDSGRAAAMPLAGLPAVSGGSLDWGSAFLQEPRGDEALAAILPIGRMSLYEFCLQISRRGCVKKIREAFFETYVSGNYIGTGVKAKADRTFDLVFAEKEDTLVLASREGYMMGIPVERLPQTIEEVFRLGPADHIVAGFAPGKKPALLVVTQTGKAIHREMSWLESDGRLKTKGQPVFSKERREAGVRVAAAAAVAVGDWGAALDCAGRLRLNRLDEVLAAGTLGLEDSELHSFTAFSVQEQVR